MTRPRQLAGVLAGGDHQCGGDSGFGRFGHQMERGDHRSEAEDDPRLLAESVGVGVAGVGAGDDSGGHRGSAEDELDAGGFGEARGVAG